VQFEATPKATTAAEQWITKIVW